MTSLPLSQILGHVPHAILIWINIFGWYWWLEEHNSALGLFIFLHPVHFFQVFKFEVILFCLYLITTLNSDRALNEYWIHCIKELVWAALLTKQKRISMKSCQKAVKIILAVNIFHSEILLKHYLKGLQWQTICHWTHCISLVTIFASSFYSHL